MNDNPSEEIISPYTSEEVVLSKTTPFHAMWEILKIRSWRIFGHHPACSVYENHYFKIFGLTFCVGCTSIYSALTLYLILFFSVPSVFRYDILVISILPFAGFGLAITHLLFKFKNKWIKAFLRFTAGFGIGAYSAIIILVPKWWIRVILAVLVLAGNQLYGMSRGRKANYSKCEDCALRTADPPCRPVYTTNVKVRKVHEIIDTELIKARERNKKNEIEISET